MTDIIQLDRIRFHKAAQNVDRLRPDLGNISDVVKIGIEAVMRRYDSPELKSAFSGYMRLGDLVHEQKQEIDGMNRNDPELPAKTAEFVKTCQRRAESFQALIPLLDKIIDAAKAD